MNTISFDAKEAAQFLTSEAVETLKKQIADADQSIKDATCPGGDFTGWYHLASETLKSGLLDEIETVAKRLREMCDTIVVAGIGGSYLGARAVIEALGKQFGKSTDDPEILFAGNNLSQDYLAELTQYLKNRRFGVINISKSGTTTETALAFRLLKKQCEEQRGIDEARQVIVCITDKVRGAARKTAEKEGYDTFVIPDNVGGRFSVLTPVGLLPIACAGFDARALVEGAAHMEEVCDADIQNNPAANYAAVRNALYRSGKKIEILANYQPKLHYMNEWWKQLYGESEGKDNKGLFPASVDLTTDLHSMGQFIQDGSRVMFETVINIDTPREELTIGEEPVDLDGLNYLAGKTVDFVNKSAMNGTILAHTDGQVPNFMVTVPEVNEFYLGELFYFFEFACGVSGYLLGVNPFNQPGVESYKKNMFALLGKPGYEAQREELLKRL